MQLTIPTTAHLERLYFELQRVGADCVGSKKPWPYHPKTREELICLAADMSRYDPRLITILVRFLDMHWNELNPAMLRKHYADMHAPQTMAVLAEFILGAGSADDEKKYFFDYLQQGLKPTPMQFYFHHLYAPGSAMATRATMMPLAEYKRWGFLACEAPVISAKERTPLGTLDGVSRKNILLDLLKKKKTIQISDYLAVLENRISRQQALNDLKSVSFARRVGRGRGAAWKFAA